MESKTDRDKLKELLEYTYDQFLYIRRTWLHQSFISLTMSNDPFVVKVADYFSANVIKGPEQFLRDDAKKFLDGPEFKTEYDTRLSTQIKEFPIEQLAQARSFATKKRKAGFKVDEMKVPSGDAIWIRWREEVSEPNKKVFKTEDIDGAFNFVKKQKVEGFEVEQEIVNGEIVVKWKDKEKPNLKKSTTSTEKPVIKKNLKK